MEMILGESERSPERRERADVEGDVPSAIGAAGPLFFLGEAKTDRMEDFIEGTLGAERGEVYAEVGKDGLDRNCLSKSSTGFLNIQLEPAIVVMVDEVVGGRLEGDDAGECAGKFEDNYFIASRPRQYSL